jgi:hypothetical protein
MENKEYDDLLRLKSLIDSNRASNEQKKEYMTILYNNGNITYDQYNRFLSNQNSDDVIKAALTIGGFMLAVWLLSKLTTE